MEKTTVERVLDELTKQAWTFTVIDFNICMTEYSLLKKESVRHKKWIAEKRFDSYFSRSSNITEQDVPLPDSVKQEAYNYYVSKLKVCKFSERKR